MSPASDLFDPFLDAFLREAAESGWSPKALKKAAASLNMGLADLQTEYPAGIPDVVERFVSELNRKVTEKTKKPTFAKMKVREKIAFCLKSRFELMAPYKGAVKRLQFWFASPAHALQGIKKLAETCDVIWNLCGDQSQDLNYYSKRLLLAGVYTSTLLYWLKDTSEDSEKTWAFLQNRLENVLAIGKFTGKFKKA